MSLLRPTVLCFLIAGPALATEPSFDCDKAETSGELAICASDDLSMMDREIARLYRLALDGPDLDEDRAAILKATQHGWIKGRDDCWKAEMGIDACIAGNYAFRIFELRQQYAGARGDDGAGISVGPVAMQCGGIEAVIGVGYVNSETPRAVLQWLETTLILDGVQSGSGARYEGTDWDDRPIVFWTKGDEALLDLPGAPEAFCQFVETG